MKDFRKIFLYDLEKQSNVSLILVALIHALKTAKSGQLSSITLTKAHGI
jgi:hypothetical protein